MLAEKTQVVLQLRDVLPAADVPRSRIVKRLDAHLELQRARRKFRDDFAQRIGQPVGDHFEMHEQPIAPAREKKLQDRAARREVQIESAIDEFELRRPAREQAVECGEKGSSANARTGISSDERQNSQVNGHPRDAST